jgi:hypothetical protein
MCGGDGTVTQGGVPFAGLGNISSPCPACRTSDYLRWLELVTDAPAITVLPLHNMASQLRRDLNAKVRKPRIKTTAVIPEQVLREDDEGNVDGSEYHEAQIEDEITDVTLEDFLK